MTSMTDTDILIIGAGPTGLLLANLLGSMNVKTTVIEANATTVQEPRAVSIDDESMRALQAVGLHKAVQEVSVAGYGSIYRGPNKKQFATVKPVSKEFGFDKRNAFQQPDLEAILRDGLKRYSCVKANFSTRMISFDQDASGVVANMQGPDGNFVISAQYMIGCDGGRSGVRKSLGIKMEGTTYKEPWLIVDLKTTKNRCFHTEVFCDPKRPCITLPGPDGIRRYEFMLHKHEDADLAEVEGFARRLLADVGPDEAEEFRRNQVYTFHARIAENWRKGRVFLAGDAAHLTPPFAGQGMNSGLRDAHNLAWKLATVLSAKAEHSLLDSYEIERKPHAWSLILLALRMGKIMMPTSSFQGALVRGAFRALGVYPPAREYFAQMKYKPKPRFEVGLIEADDKTVKETIVGQMIPQPVVEDHVRKQVLLDTVLPDKPVLLIYAERPEVAISAKILQDMNECGVVVIGLTPEWTTPSKAEFPIVRDRSRIFSTKPFIGYLNHAILLRRDRYVAGTRSVDQLSELLGLVRMINPSRLKDTT
ncbi:monooxygenase [Alphaproteobacteria bacterium 46_93_T64]|nr:monooxygenase [Alphaproteobacteria bacterium 46_93_T64]